jgi:NAD(P)-dependent dehydrogenase (short-subunit alcohol dehydrogenase family)
VPGNSTYSATKAALRSYVRTWTREFTDRGIRFNTLSPGPIDTPMIDSTADPDAVRAAFVAAIPLNRMGRPEEIAAAALFWPPMRPVSWPAPNSASMAAWHRSNDRTGPVHLGSTCGAHRR